LLDSIIVKVFENEGIAYSSTFYKNPQFEEYYSKYVLNIEPVLEDLEEFKKEITKDRENVYKNKMDKTFALRIIRGLER
jgi:hypothetical protein